MCNTKNIFMASRSILIAEDKYTENNKRIGF